MTTTTTTTSASITPIDLEDSSKVEISTGGSVQKNQKWENQMNPKIMQYGIIVLLTVITVALGTALAVVLVKSNSSKSASNTISSSSSSIEVTTNIQASSTPLQIYDDTAITSKEQSDLWNIKSAAFRLIASQIK